MAITPPKTVRYAFDTRLTNLATNTALSTATRHDFTAVTIYLPETTSRTFRSVVAVVSFRDASTSGNNLTGVRVGIKLGSASFSDTDFTPTAQGNTADPETVGPFVVGDWASYFTTNFGAGGSQTCQVGIAVAQAGASNVTNIAVELLITYDHSDADTTRVKTVEIPIQSHHTTITNSYQEIGTTGGTANASANQIPQLSTFLPENSATVRQAYIVLEATDGGNAVTDFNLAIKIDSGGATNTRATLEQAQNGSAYFRDVFIYDTSTYATSSAHALYLQSSTTARFQCIGARLIVTYEYNETNTTTMLVSVRMPLGQHHTMCQIAGSVGGDRDRYWFDLWVEEPTTITFKQSGVVLYYASPSGGALSMLAPSQTARTYTLTGYVLSGQFVITHRTDHSSSNWTLARGKNRLSVGVSGDASSIGGAMGGYAIVNYHAGKPTGGTHLANQTTAWFGHTWLTSGSPSIFREISSYTYPVWNPTSYWINGFWVETYMRNSAAPPQSVALEVGAGEYTEEGWICQTHGQHSDGELGTSQICYDFTAYVNRTNYEGGKLDVFASRKLRHQSISTSSYSSALLWLTAHGITFAVSGTVSNYADADGAGLTVNIFRAGDDEKVTSVTTTTGGAYTATVYDSANDHYAVCNEDATHNGASAKVTPS